MPQSTNLNILLSGCCKFYAALTAKDVRSQERIIQRLSYYTKLPFSDSNDCCLIMLVTLKACIL